MDAVLLGAVLLGALLPTAPLPPTPRELARSVLEAHGHDVGSGLRLLKLHGVSRTRFDWGTHYTINLTARDNACTAGRCTARQGRQIRRCVAQISVFSFLPDAPLSLLECGR